MTTPQQERYEKLIREKLPTHSSVEHAAEMLRNDFESMGVNFSLAMEEYLVSACKAVKASLAEVEILRRCSILKIREKWYDGPKSSDNHWPALEGYLRNTKGWEKDTIDSIGDTSTEVVSLLANPSADQFRCRGLVVGYVQSGKTANMTAVIAKAVDAGYNMIVLLAGMTNKLRAQTQRRLQADIVERHRHLWQLYTNSEDTGDFEFPPNSSFTMPRNGHAQIVVMKKITSRLNAFHLTIKKTSPTILCKLKVLLIDDECDQASVNSAKEDFDITKINEAIRKIIRDLPAVSYVGYTATPFANVFIDPFPHNRDTLDDLYPEDFITSLPKPIGYFGAREVFGMDPLDADAESDVEQGKHIIRAIPDEEMDMLRPKRAADKDIFTPIITTTLENALLWYIASCSIRKKRKHSGVHMTMLVHASPNIIQHERMADAIDEWLRQHSQCLRTGKGQIFKRFCEVYYDELDKVIGRQIRSDPIELLDEIAETLKEIRVAVENGESDRRIDYTDGPKLYIVIGGAVLARGLTLEGLCVSFFLRTSKQYDTLLQMGRWFGYRHGYEDLPRLWTTDALASNFRALARIEEEIREDISEYRERNVTPLEFAVKVRSIPSMAITSASKMKHAYRTSISFEGRHIQTIRFDHRDDNVIAGNWSATSQLLGNIEQNVSENRTESQILYVNVQASIIRRFLVDYDISDQHMDLKKSMLLGYIDKAVTRLPVWNVVVIQSRYGKQSQKPLGILGKVFMVNRSKLVAGEQSYADIKALMSKADVLADVEKSKKPTGSSWIDYKALRPAIPLLLIYPIDGKSVPKKSGGQRGDLDAAADLVGIGIVFPGEADQSGSYFQVHLASPTPEQLDEEEMVEEMDVSEARLTDG